MVPCIERPYYTWRFGGLSQFLVSVCGYIRNNVAVYGYEIIARLRKIITLSRGFRSLRF